MVRIRNFCLSFLLIAVLFSGTASASTMPPADLKAVNVGVSLVSPGVSIDIPWNSNLFTGASIALPVYYGNLFGTIRYDLHVFYQLIKDHDSVLSFGGIAGLWGDYSFSSKTYQNTWVSFQAGVGIAYKFTKEFTGRLNIVAAIPSSEYGWFAPSAGIEFTYTPVNNIELSLGITGQGDFLGAKWKF